MMASVVRIILLSLVFFLPAAAQDSRPASGPVTHYFTCGYGETSAARKAVVADCLRDLESADSRTAAWAAFAAGMLDISAARPALLSLLDRLADPAVSDRPERVNACLEALRAIGSSLPDETLGRFFSAEPALCLLIACRDPENHPAFLADVARNAKEDEYRQAAVNALIRSQPRVAASASLVRIELTLNIAVFDVEDDGGSTSFGGGSVGGTRTRATGFPPLARYTATFSDRLQPIVLSPGAVPVYALRAVIAEDRFNFFGSQHDPVLDAERRLVTLAALLKVPAPSIVPPSQMVRLRARSAAEFLKEARAAREAYRGRFQELVAALDRAGLLDQEARESAGSPEITVNVDDRRTLDKTPLPPLDPTPDKR